MELQQLESLRSRIEILDNVDSHVGTYISKQWVQKNILRQTDEEIKEIASQIKKEEGAGETTVTPAGPELPPEAMTPEEPPAPEEDNTLT
jgi:predicted Zn-dependent peptidase